MRAFAVVVLALVDTLWRPHGCHTEPVRQHRIGGVTNLHRPFDLAGHAPWLVAR